MEMEMENKSIARYITIVILLLSFSGCQVFKIASKTESRAIPENYNKTQISDSTNTAQINWRKYFTDPNLVALIDTALNNNQELNIIIQEIQMSKNEVRARKGEYLPFLNIGGSAGFDKVGKYTRNGAVEENLEVKSGTAFPEPVPDFMFGAYASWEIDVWKKLRNAKKSAALRYLSTMEGKNFMITNLVSEIASSYYELMALDNLLNIIKNNIEIQTNALQVVKQQKEAGKVSQLAVNRFEAQLLNTKNRQYEILQQIVETENKLNFLTGRFPQPIPRNSATFKDINIDSIYSGIPSQLLENRPDIRKAELELMAAKLDVEVAKANFYPSFRITAGAGFQAFNPTFLVSPESILYSLAGDLVAPLINRNAIKATYYNANSKQIQAVYNYERSILNAYIDVVNQLSNVDNFNKSYEIKLQEVNLLHQSITISNSLFNSGRADYVEVLLTQREALESTVEQIEIKLKQLNANVNMYRALGGGWK
jgi:NodT family efflux transporter outer membrane factor (OMF) lipoprotein